MQVSSPDGEVCIPADECECKVIDGVTYVDGQKIEHMSDQCRSWLVMILQKRLFNKTSDIKSDSGSDRSLNTSSSILPQLKCER